ncbi:MAG: hypothetical protein NXI20_12180 [bacterium]|nr:hypothetical protein [bacterium]
MKTLSCLILDPNNFTSVLLEEFVEKTPELEILIDDINVSRPHLVFVDSEYYNEDIFRKFESDSIIVISSEEELVRSYFKNDILDFVMKEDLSYNRFLSAVTKYRSRQKNKAENL